jgi:hypothetical protein
MDTSGTGQRDATRGGIGTISRQSARPARGGRVRPEPVPEPVPGPPVEPAERRARPRQPTSKGLQASQRLPESPPKPRNARTVPPPADPTERRARRRRPEAVRPEAVRPEAVRPLAVRPQEAAQQRNLMPVAPAPQRNARPAPPMPTGAPAPQRTQAPSQAPPAQAPSPAESAPPRQASPQSVPRSIRAVTGSHRMPFMLLLCGLLGGALVSALLISTTLAEGSFQITRLQNSTNALFKQRQVLQEEVAQAQSAQVIQSRALKLGMRTQGQLRFIDLKTGKTSSDHGTGWENAINVPGYTP